MNRISLKQNKTPLFRSIAAAVVAFTAGTASFADTSTSGLDQLLAEPTNFVAISEGAPGQVTFASMAGDRLAVQFVIPTHAGDTFGEIVGDVDEQGVFHGNSMLISENGRGEASPVTMTFNNDGTIVANVKDGVQGSGFMTTEMFAQF